jgi:hypothetical protein
MKRSLLIWLIVGLAPRIFAMSVLLIQTDNAIYLAADSLATETATGDRLHICEIHNSGAAYWAAAGTIEEKGVGYRVEEIVASIGTEGTIESRMKKFTSAVRAPFDTSCLNHRND